MDTRVLKYFLTVAHTSNITKAAQQLHLTQPTLSRQIMELEKELGVPLFDRNQRHLILTPEGTMFEQRAKNIIALITQAKDELQNTEKDLSGSINIGCVVSSVSPYLMKVISKFQGNYPHVQFNIYDGNSDLLRQRLDAGLDDLTVLLEPVEAAKYNFIELPVKERWGLLAKADDPITNKKVITRSDLYKLPLIAPVRNIVRDEISDVLKLDQSKLNIKATNNLPNNAYQLLLTGKYYGLAIEGVAQLAPNSTIKFIPFSPSKETGHVITWRKNTTLSPAIEKFLQTVADSN